MNRIDPINPIPSLRPRIDCGRLAVLRMIPPLQPPATLHLEAAQAWLDLGNRAEAEAELKQIPRESRNHPSVIKVEIDMSTSIRSPNP